MAKKIDIKLDREVFNDVYLPYLEDDTRLQIFFGGASSGKSVFVVGQRTAYDLLQGDRNYLIIRNVARTSRNSTFNEVQKVIRSWGVQDYFKVNKSDMVITCANGYQALFGGLDDVEKLKSITPAKGVLTDVVIEEATETKEFDIKQLNKRLRGKAKVKKRLAMLFNPIIRSHWIHKNFFANRFYDDDKVYADDQLKILKTTYLDNKFLEPDDIYELENETDAYFRAVYTMGLWGTLGGVVFTNWRVDDLTPEIPRFDNIHNGLDFGFTNDPTAYNRTHYDRARKKIYIFEELHGKGWTNQRIVEELKPIIHKEQIVCDSAEPKSIQELINLGINAIGAIKGKDSITHGIQWLKQNEIIIDRRCQETINEFQLYQWAKDKYGEDTNTPVDRNNHHIDGIRYQYENEALQGSGDIIDIGPSQASMGDWYS